MLFFLFLLASVFVALVTQEFVPPLPWLHGARIFLMPIVFFYGALVLPSWLMLALAFCTGFMWDALVAAHAVDSVIEIPLGWSIVFYAAFGAIMSGFRPLYQRGHGWEIHCLMCGPLISLFVLAEFLMITFRRGEFLFPQVIWWRIGGAGLIAIVIAPVVYFIMHSFAVSFGWAATRHERRKAVSA